MRSHTRHWLAVASIVLVGCAGHGGDGSRWVPEDAGLAIIAPTVDGLRGQLTTALAGVEGASGLLDLLEARAGLDLRTRAGLEAAGIDPDASLSVFEHQGAVGLAVGVTRAARFHDRVARQVARMGVPTVTTLEAADGPVGVADVEGSLAWGTGPDDVGLVVWSPEQGTSAEHWRQLAAARRSDDTLMDRATAALGDHEGAFLVATGPPKVPPSWGLGALNVALMPVVAGLTDWEGIWHIEPERMAWTMAGKWTTEGASASDWFQPAGVPVTFADALPKSQTLTARARLNLAKVRGLPAFLRKRVIPERVPGALGGLLPPVMELLTLLNGDVALTVLGLDEEATVDHAIGRSGLAGVLQLVHVAALLGVTDASAARAAIVAATERLGASGWIVSPLASDGWSGFALRSERSSATWSVIQRDRVVAVMSGTGEVARFVRVAKGTALSLGESAEGPVATAAASSPEVAVGLNAGFRRITRELATKGFPPFFLQMVNDLRAISGTLRFRPDGAAVDLEVRL